MAKKAITKVLIALVLSILFEAFLLFLIDPTYPYDEINNETVKTIEIDNSNSITDHDELVYNSNTKKETFICIGFAVFVVVIATCCIYVDESKSNHQ